MSVLVCAIGIALPYTRLGPYLGFVSLPSLYWPMLAAMIVAYLLLTHGIKTWLMRQFAVD